MLTPEEITEGTFRQVANKLLQEQMEYSTTYIHDEISRWDETFVSDDGTDYVQTAIDALETLMRIRYEGDAETLKDFLFTSRHDYEVWVEDPNRDTRFLLGEPAMVIDSAEGLCPTIQEIVQPMYDAEDAEYNAPDDQAHHNH